MMHHPPDPSHARSIAQAARRRVDYTMTLESSSESAATIVSNIYEAFRMLGEAMLITKGTNGRPSHEQCLKTLLTLNLRTKRPLSAIKTLQRIRNNINYEGYDSSTLEANDAKSFANECFVPVFNEVMKQIGN